MNEFMRKLTEHKVNPINDLLEIHVVDEPGASHANLYVVTIGESAICESSFHIKFQNGPIAEVGVNGLTHEVLLAIIADRLRAFQKGPYVCRENALALTKIEEAMHWLHHRTRGRMTRGVEGTSKK